MSILVNKETKVIVQGITGRLGAKQTRLMLDYGTKIVAGVTPGKGGSEIHGVPVYDTVSSALSNHSIDASVIYVPASHGLDAAVESIDSGIGIVVIITEHIPIHDAIKIKQRANLRGVKVIGPNSPGIITPGETSLGMIPPRSVLLGKVGIVSRSGTLTFEVVKLLTDSGIGQSTCLGLGGDSVTGLNYIDVLKLFENDRSTEIIVMIGEIGGTSEERAAEYIVKMKKSVVGFIAGYSAPQGKTMGHAGAIVTGNRGTAESKTKALKEADIPVAETPWEIVDILKSKLKLEGD